MDNPGAYVNNYEKQDVLPTGFCVAGEFMRLICPNCGAQYEVDARVIPDGGRDVQCSNCGHTWFQKPAILDNELAEELGYELTQDDAQDAVQDEGVPEFEEEAEPEFEPEGDIAPAADGFVGDDTPDPEQVGEEASEEPWDDDMPEVDEAPEEAADEAETAIAGMMGAQEFDADADTEAAEFEDDDVDDEAPIDAAPREMVSESVRDILQAEVEFDQSMREPDNSQLESQPDLGLSEPESDPSKKSLRDRMARLRGLDPTSAEGAGGIAAATGKRRDLLPDIEEINSTLSASSERDKDGSVPDEETRKGRAQRSGFRSVFLLIVLSVLILMALYLIAPFIAQKIPALATVLEGFVSTVNKLRAALDGLMSAASARMNALLGQLSS